MIPYLQVLNLRLIQLIIEAGVLEEFNRYITEKSTNIVILGTIYPPSVDESPQVFVERCLTNVRVNITFMYNVFKYL